MTSQLSLFQLPPVHRGISWMDLFGHTMRDMDAATRRERWEACKAIARGQDERQEMEMYETDEGCVDERGTCVHFSGGWCDLMGLPTGYNPVMRMLGMACCGVGFRIKSKERA